MTILVVAIWTSIYYADHIANPTSWAFDAPDTPEAYYGLALKNHTELGGFLLIACPPLLLLVVAAAAFPASVPGVERYGLDHGSEIGRYALGMLSALVVAVVLIYLGTWIHFALGHRSGLGSLAEYEWAKWSFRAFPTMQLAHVGHHDAGAEHTAPVLGDRAASLVMLSYFIFTAVLAVYYLVFCELLKRWLSSGHAACILAGMLVGVYSFVVSLNSSVQPVFFGVVIVLVVLANSSPKKYRFPKMGDAYREPVRLKDLQETTDPPPGVPLISGTQALDGWWERTVRARLEEARHDGGRPLRDRQGQAIPRERLPEADAVRDLAALRAWCQAGNVERPKLVLVAVTGAAYRSAFWTATVLEELTRLLPDFGPSVRVIAGASGGMVGAAYYAAMAGPKGGPPGADVVARLRADSRLDSLTPVVKRLLRRDLFRGLVPFLAQDYDRGVVLEEQWKALGETSFRDLYDGEVRGWRPSLIVSPLVIESGRRLLFSNLDLACLTQVRPGPGEPVYSRPAAEFFRAFPGLYGEFLLRTAIRMNATFPYISPAVSLPTDPPRRPVDAGYYDNYGVDLACSWAYEQSRWLREHTSGVALVQIRAYPSERRRQEYYDPDRDAPPPAGPSRWSRLKRAVAGSFAPRVAFQFLTSPAEAAGSARAWSMSYRNDEEVRGLDDLFHERYGRSRRFFETFVFENPLGFAMNWFLSDVDLDEMAYCIDARSDVGHMRTKKHAHLAHLDRTRQTNLARKVLLERWWTAPDAATA
jgi:hypothetical protein